MKKNLYLIILFVFFAITTNAQERGSRHQGGEMPNDGSLSGTVQDASIKKAVEYANVVLYRQNDSSLVTGVVTDQNGNFVLKDLPYGRYYVEVNFIGYKKKTITSIKINPKQKDVTLGIFELKRSFTDLDEVEVVAEKPLIEFKIDKKIVNVSQDISSTGATAVEVLENTPSVQTDIDGNVTLRGSSNFTVLIDGKPTILESSEALEQIPASTIEKIEIITNPSAKYEPDGIAGIINVIMKKQTRPGFSGIVNGSVGTGDKYSGDFLLNYRTGKFNLFGGLEYSYRNSQGSSIMERETYLNDTTYYLTSNSERGRYHDGYVIKAGTDYYINTNNTLSFEGKTGLRGHGHNSFSRYLEYTMPEDLDQYYINNNFSGMNRKYYSLNLYYQHKFEQKGHELSVSAFFTSQQGTNSDSLFEYTADETWEIIGSSTDKQRSSEENTRNDLKIKTDYTKPLGENGKFEAGYHASFDIAEADYTFENYEQSSGSWLNNDSLSNDLEFSRNIQAIYGTLSNLLLGFEYQLGLRAEYTDRNLNQITTNEQYTVNRFDLFPTFHVSRELPLKQQLQASYSRRINRPRDRYLNPFPRYHDQLNIHIGNPGLEPEYIDSYELSYLKRIKSSFFSIEAYYRQTNNKIARINTLQDDNIMVRTFDNLDKDYSLGVELMGNLELYKWWRLNISGNLYKYHIDGEILDMDEVAQTINTWNMRMNSTFILKFGTRIQLTGFYTGPSVTAQGDRGEFFVISAAVKQDFLKRKFSLTFQVRDIFQTMKHSFTSKGNDFYTYHEFTREAPVFTLSFSYRIKNYKQKKRERESMESDYGEED
ncbi:MAG: TonB-dependent receptor [Bacteroidota bacterium]